MDAIRTEGRFPKWVGLQPDARTAGLAAAPMPSPRRALLDLRTPAMDAIRTEGRFPKWVGLQPDARTAGLAAVPMP